MSRRIPAPGLPFLAVSWKLVGLLGLAFVFLLYGTVAVFEAFDRNSNSASDTIRPFVITMAPVWAVAIGAARVLLQRNRS